MTYDKKTGTTITDELQSVFSAEYNDASSYMDETVAEVQARMTDYYKGELPGITKQDLDDNRSDIVSRDVHDAFQAVAPDLMRVFLGPDHVVEFSPKGPDDVQTAEQATEAIRHIFESDNDAYGLIYGALKDGLIRRYAVAHWWHEVEEKVYVKEYTGLSLDQVALLTAEEGAEVLELDDQTEQLIEEEADVPPADESEAATLPDGTPNPQAKVVSLTLKHKRREHCYKVELVPPEEIVVSRRARVFGNGMFVARRRNVMVDELVDMGYDREEVLEHVSMEQELENSELQQARAPESVDSGPQHEYEGAKKTLYVEGYMHWPTDEGELALHKVCALGTANYVVRAESVECVPMAFWTPDPEPHTVIGESDAEKVADVQRLKTEIWRGVLDSLAEAIVPRTEVVEGQVNLDDALSNEIGALVRVRQPNMVRPLTTPFVGQQALPLFELADQMREERVGAFRAADGLSAEAMQSSTKMAVAATISGSKARKELLARGFAWNFMRPIFRGLLRLFVENQDKKRWVRMLGAWTPVDPRAWNAELDCSIDLAMAMAPTEEKIGVFQGIAEKQELILQTAGPDNPICGFAEYSATLRKLIQLAGVKNPDAYFKRMDPNAPAQKPPEPPPDPAMLVAQAQVQALQREQDRKDFEAKQKADLERDKLVQDAHFRTLELQEKGLVDAARAAIALKAEQDNNNVQMQRAAAAAQRSTAPAAPGNTGV